MKRSLAWIVSGFALIPVACVAQVKPSTNEARIGPTSRIDMEKACPGTRWVAVLRPNNRVCPQAPGFSSCNATDVDCRVRAGMTKSYSDPNGASLTADEQKKRTANLRDSGLDRICLYEAPDDSQPSTPRIPRTSVLRLDKDCRSSVALGSDLETMTWQSLRTQFLEQTGRASFVLNLKGKKARLAILDTQPTGEGFPDKQGCSPHGYTLAHMAGNLVCETPGGKLEQCAAKVTTRLALRVKSQSRSVRAATEPCEGGLVGWIGDLGVAIFDEIERWDRKKDADNLIINLSVGWDSDLFGGLTEAKVDNMSGQVQSVYRALLYAASRKVLVIAAAGNSTPGPTRHEGPILPAGWEGGLPGSKEKLPQPLIYAVGGVRWNDYPISNARPKATPSRVAYADHGVVQDPAKKIGPTAVLTGTSVSTLVVSAAASLVWAEKSSLTPLEVIQKLEKDWGGPTQLIADFGIQAGSKVRRICLGGPKSCRSAKASFSYTPTLDSFAPLTMDASSLAATPVVAPCEPSKKYLKRPGAPNPVSLCPNDQFESATLQAWVDPQPDSDPCPYCSGKPPGGTGAFLGGFGLPLAGFKDGGREPGLGDTAELYIDIPGDWWLNTPSLEATTLELAYSNGDEPDLTVLSYSLNQSFSKSGPTSLKVKGLAGPPLVNPILRSATLNFVLQRDGQKMSVSSPLFFSP